MQTVRTHRSGPNETNGPSFLRVQLWNRLFWQIKPACRDSSRTFRLVLKLNPDAGPLRRTSLQMLAMLLRPSAAAPQFRPPSVRPVSLGPVESPLLGGREALRSARQRLWRSSALRSQRCRVISWRLLDAPRRLSVKFGRLDVGTYRSSIDIWTLNRPPWRFCVARRRNFLHRSFYADLRREKLLNMLVVKEHLKSWTFKVSTAEDSLRWCNESSSSSWDNKGVPGKKCRRQRSEQKTPAEGRRSRSEAPKGSQWCSGKQRRGQTLVKTPLGQFRHEQAAEIHTDHWLFFCGFKIWNLN